MVTAQTQTNFKTDFYYRKQKEDKIAKMPPNLYM